MRLVYVAGPFRGACPFEQEENIRRAEALALAVWRVGAVGVCPHSMTRNWQGAIPDGEFLAGDLDLMRRCDAVLLTPDWRRSAGARTEEQVAREHGLPVFETLDALREWVRPVQGRTGS